jgi:hypothetical protein
MAKKSQIDKFKEAAREIGAEQSEKAFNASLTRVAKASVSQSANKKSKRKAKR